MLERFGAGDRRFIAVCLVVAVVCGVLAWRTFGRAFPEASIEFTVNRTESRQVAADFLTRLGQDPGAWKHAVLFDFDDETKTFLERTLGLDRAQEVYGKQVRLWRWSHRWFRPHEKEELRVEVTAGGEIARYAHLLPEDAPGATLPQDAARAIAETFLTEKLRIPLAEYEFLEASSTRQPQRLDHTFTWKKRGLELGDPDASYRIRATVAGDVASGYEEFLDIPQAWQDAYARLRARNDTAALVATLFLLLTTLAMIGSLVLRIRDHDVRWPIVLRFGIVGFVLQLLATLNQFDLEKFTYQTQDSYASFVTDFALQAVLGALAFGGFILLLTAAAEPIYRERYPGKIALTGFFSWRGLRTKQFFKEVLLGLTLMLFFAAYQAVFYILAAKQGAWAPLEVPYSNLLNTAFPWALVLFIGFFPAVSEEFMSRMFSVPFLDKHLGRAGLPARVALVAAVVLSSYIWGFAHSNYPNQPYWIRGVEVGTAGVIVCFIMLRWGILATLVWHYTVDAFYTSLLMLRSGNEYFFVSGAVTSGIMLVPLVVSLILYWKNGGFESPSGIRNADDPGARPVTAEEPAPTAVASSFQVPSEPEHRRAQPSAIEPAREAPLGGRRLILGVALAAASLLLLLVPITKPGEGIELASSRKDALEAAREHLRALGGDPDRYRVALQQSSRFDDAVGRYVLEHTTLERLNEIFTGTLRTPVWRVRYFRPDEREEWFLNLPVNVAPSAGGGPRLPLWAFEHTLPDSAPGDTLSTAAAQNLAEGFLRARGVDPAALELKDSRSEKQKARIDHTFEWQAPDSTLGEGGVRTVVVVRGGAVAGLRPYMHLPEAWLRADEERSVLQRILWVLSRGIVMMLVLSLASLFVAQVRARSFRWGVGLRWGVVAALLSLIGTALTWRSDIAMRYETTMPWQLFLVGAGISVVIQFVLIGLLAAVIVGTALGVRPGITRLAGGNERRWVRDGIVLALLGVALQIGVNRFGAILTSLAPQYARIGELFQLPEAARPASGLDIAVELARSAILQLPVLALLGHLLGKQLGWKKSAGILGLALLLFAAEGARSVPEFALSLAGGVLGAAAFATVFAVLFRGNELAYVLAFLGGRGLAAAWPWFEQPASGAVATGAAAGAFAALLAVLAVWSASRRGVDGTGVTSSRAF